MIKKNIQIRLIMYQMPLYNLWDIGLFTYVFPRSDSILAFRAWRYIFLLFWKKSQWSCSISGLILLRTLFTRILIISLYYSLSWLFSWRRTYLNLAYYLCFKDVTFWYFIAVIYLMHYIGNLINVESSRDNSIFIIILLTSFLFLLYCVLYVCNFCCNIFYRLS